MTWLTALTAWPEPAGPKWVIFEPSRSRSGRARSTRRRLARRRRSSGSPSGRPRCRPRRGRRRRPRRPRARRAAKARVDRRADRRAVDDEAAPGQALGSHRPARTGRPPRPGVSDTQTKTTSAAAAAELGRAGRLVGARPRRAPPARPGVRFQTVSGIARPGRDGRPSPPPSSRAPRTRRAPTLASTLRPATVRRDLARHSRRVPGAGRRPSGSSSPRDP